MAKHMVVCKICGKRFDTNEEPFVKVSSTRYAHEACVTEKEQKDIEKYELEEYIKQLFHITKITGKIDKQIKKYVTEYNYSYTGIQRCLIYFYEIKGNSLDKANEGIGIVPYIWEEVRQYYYNLWLAQQKNISKDLSMIKTINITIPPPERKIKKKKSLFSFLEKEE